MYSVLDNDSQKSRNMLGYHVLNFKYKLTLTFEVILTVHRR